MSVRYMMVHTGDTDMICTLKQHPIKWDKRSQNSKINYRECVQILSKKPEGGGKGTMSQISQGRLEYTKEGQGQSVPENARLTSLAKASV